MAQTLMSGNISFLLCRPIGIRSTDVHSKIVDIFHKSCDIGPTSSLTGHYIGQLRQWNTFSSCYKAGYTCVGYIRPYIVER